MIGVERFFEGFWGDGFVVEDDGDGHVGFGCGFGVTFGDLDVAEEDACFSVEGAFGLEADGFVESFSGGVFIAGGDECAAFDEEAFGAHGGFCGVFQEVLDGSDGGLVVAGFDVCLGEEEPVCGAGVLIF